MNRNLVLQIENFEGLGNETFNSLKELYADNNKINTLKHLEGTEFLGGFQNFSVRSNKIDEVSIRRTTVEVHFVYE